MNNYLCPHVGSVLHSNQATQNMLISTYKLFTSPQQHDLRSSTGSHKATVHMHISAALDAEVTQVWPQLQ